jgi:hypothetical protein
MCVWRYGLVGPVLPLSVLLNLSYRRFVEIFGCVICLQYSLYVHETKHTKKANTHFPVGFKYTIRTFDL